MLAGLPDLRASEDPQDKALISTAEAFTAAARGQPQDALRHARAALAHAGALGISHDLLRWAWPLAARAAHELGDTAAAGELLALLDCLSSPGTWRPMQRAERDLVRARLAAGDGDPGRRPPSPPRSRSLRELSTPYHLAHGLLDHAQFLRACTMPKLPRRPSAKPATSPVTCAVSRCWTGPHTSRPQHPLQRLRAARYLARTILSRGRSRSGLIAPIAAAWARQKDHYLRASTARRDAQ